MKYILTWLCQNNQHTVFQTIDDELAERTITFTAPSKTFNLAGMGISNIIIKNKNLRRKFIDCLNRNCSTISFIALGYKACEWSLYSMWRMVKPMSWSYL